MATILVDKDKCNGDGICAAECPARLINMNEDKFPVVTNDFDDVCVRCGHCVAVCPTGAFGLDWLTPEECQPISADLEISRQQAEQFLRSRRSIRVFSGDPVGRATLEKLVQVACHAPSAKNVQPWGWIIVENPEWVSRLDKLVVDWMRSVIRSDPASAEAMRLPRTVELADRGEYKALRNAPHLFVVHVDRNWTFGAEDTALALSYAELLAPAFGLGATWSGYFYRAYNAYPPLAAALPVPGGRRVTGALMVGRPKFKYHRMPLRNAPKIEWR